MFVESGDCVETQNSNESQLFLFSFLVSVIMG
jgi:hypothetical protein